MIHWSTTISASHDAQKQFQNFIAKVPKYHCVKMVYYLGQCRDGNRALLYCCTYATFVTVFQQHLDTHQKDREAHKDQIKCRITAHFCSCLSSLPLLNYNAEHLEILVELSIHLEKDVNECKGILFWILQYKQE